MVMDALRKSYVSSGKPQKVLAGLSGGADSVALLVSLCELRREWAVQLFAVHVNHGLRENAALDEAFCRALCEKLSVPLDVVRVQIEGTGNIEAKAREARYNAFAAVKEKTGAEMLALAHHLDDQAETMLLHLLYGTGAAGLGGMHECANGVWRPFLKLRRKDLQAYLTMQNAAWREDESNADAAFTRNRIRGQIIPVLEAEAPETVRSMGRTADILRDEDACLNNIAETWIAAHASRSGFAFLPAASLKKEHPALQRRILRRYASRLEIVLDFAQTERLRKLLNVQSGETENLPGGWRALRSKTRLHFLPDAETDHLKNMALGALSADTVCEGFSPRCIQPVPAHEMHDLEIRTRRMGDYIQPFGMQGRKTLKEYFIDHGVDRPFRDAWPLVCRGSEVLWVIGVGASEKLRVYADDENKLIYAGNLPDECGEDKK